MGGGGLSGKKEQSKKKRGKKRVKDGPSSKSPIRTIFLRPPAMAPVICADTNSHENP